MSQGNSEILIRGIYVYSYGEYRNCAKQNVKSQFFALEKLLEIAEKNEIIQIEIHRKDEHKNADNYLYIRAVVKSYAGIFIGKSPRSGGAERVNKAVVKRHFARSQKHHLHGGQNYINRI